ncbi:helix-turn-helix transcriptional regulator [Spirillospora sp. NPDC029432]|uniref:helix-turn-helix transcriptional regulator n=1 Tax=Spirillospora sp. NPDC029432 TaxID=3154599 RepID=UPI003455F947
MEEARYQESPAPAGMGLACLWSHRHPGDAGGPFVQRVVPDGCVDLIWWSRSAEITVAGPDTGPAPARLEPGERLVAVRFRPGTAPPVLGVPADAVRDARPPLRELWGDAAGRLGEAMAAAPDPHALLVEAVRARSVERPDPLVPALVSGLVSGLMPGLEARPVREVAGALGVSERQLRRRAHAAFGYGPKTLQRVLRFQRALRMARAGVPLAEVAYAAGYADQAHLANEVRGLAGAPIRTLL